MLRVDFPRRIYPAVAVATDEGEVCVSYTEDGPRSQWWPVRIVLAELSLHVCE